ncbi:MAG: MarR family transcriptional regulator [Bacteroidota bacterium]
MRIEKEIRQAVFESEHHKLRVNLLFTSNWLANEIRQFLHPFDLTQKQFNILRILRNYPGEIPPSVLDVRDRMIDKMSDASRIIDRLEKKGLIRRKPCTMDKRASRILITDKALELLAQIDENSKGLQSISAHLGEQKARQLNQLLEELREGRQED